MKKIYYLSVVLIGLLTIVSCSKDNDTPAKELGDSYSGASLIAYNGDKTESNKCPNAAIKVTAIDNNNAKLDLQYCVSGYASYEMEAKVIKTKSDESYTITGTSTKSGEISVDFSGIVTNGVLTATIKNTILSTDIVKTWTVNASSTGTLDFINFKATTKSGKANMPNSGIANATTDQFNETLTTWINMIVGIGVNNPKLSMQSDGYVSFSAVSPFATGGIDYKNITRYSYDPSTKILSFEIPMSLFVKSKTTDVSTPIFYLKFKCSFENGVLTANLDETTTKMLLALIPTGTTLAGYLSQLDNLFPAEYAFMLPILKGLITDTANILTSDDLTSLVLGGKLAPAK